ncbi:MAG: CYTH domain-containing protein [Bacteroidota bacterium]
MLENQIPYMGLEIERKFLLKNSDWEKLHSQKISMRQGYLNTHPERTVRVRVSNQSATLTIKGKTQNTTRQEFEYQIPFEEGGALLNLCEKPLIEKVRFIVKYQDKVWEIDRFEGENEGLVVAEVELDHEGEEFILPAWIGEEVSHDPRFYNASLIKQPFKSWG